MNKPSTHFPEPEILTRQDTEPGRWTVDACAAKRGVPHTIIPERVMKAPVDSSPMSRCIRAHEMMHAKCSPGIEFQTWIDREIASADALHAVEEVRVNLLCQKAGFDMKSHLSDDGETYDGERGVALRDWRGCVLMAIACAGTASHKKFLTGVRRHDRFWGKCLLDISKRALKEMEKAYRQGNLASTEVHGEAGIAPMGFVTTERIAEWVDRIAEQEPPPPPEPEPEKAETADGEDGTGTITADGNADGDEKGDLELGERQLIHSNVGPANLAKEEGFGERLKGITPDQHHYDIPRWTELRVEKLPLTVLVPGTIGKKRIASNTGRHPRRLHRYLTDPEMRIFDRTIKGMGGVMVLDCSGSMDLTKKQIREILQAAPGMTVLGYTDRGTGTPNAWVLANKGRMCEELPFTGSGNGVDLPAIEWGVAHKQRSGSPVIWVSDGGVCGEGQGSSDTLAMACIKYCIRNRVIVVPHLDEAIEMLKKMKRGQKGRTHWPRQLRYVYKKMNGSSINDDYPMGW
jgi:hypothetical protein